MVEWLVVAKVGGATQEMALCVCSGLQMGWGIRLSDGSGCRACRSNKLAVARWLKGSKAQSEASVPMEKPQGIKPRGRAQTRTEPSTVNPPAIRHSPLRVLRISDPGFVAAFCVADLVVMGW